MDAQSSEQRAGDRSSLPGITAQFQLNSAKTTRISILGQQLLAVCLVLRFRSGLLLHYGETDAGLLTPTKRGFCRISLGTSEQLGRAKCYMADVFR